MKPLVIYHGNCFDGFTAAWAFWNVYKNVEFWPAQRGPEPPDCTGRRVFLLDFCYSREQMKRIILQSDYTVVLDHHKTAEADLSGILTELLASHQRSRPDYIVLDMQRSGAGITWDFMNGCHSLKGPPRPWLVDYVEDRDLWRWALPNSREVSAYIASVPMTFEAWDELAAMDVKDVAEQGRGIMRYIDTYGEEACKQARFHTVGGYWVPTINVSYQNGSDHVGKLLDKHEGACFAVGYFRRGDGAWQFSLRSRKDFDVSRVAQGFGGGGHAQAAGFVAKDLEAILGS